MCTGMQRRARRGAGLNDAEGVKGGSVGSEVPEGEPGPRGPAGPPRDQLASLARGHPGT